MLHHISMRQKIIVMLAVMAGLFLVALDQTIIATALSKIVEEFDSYSSMGLVVTAYLLLSTVTVPIAGKFSDMFGRRPVLLTGVIIFTIGSLLSGSSQNIEQLIAWRALQGFGGGIIMANAFTIIGDLFSPRERGRWQGLFGAVFGLSSVIGPLLGGWLTDGQHLFGMTTDWRWTFWINVPVGIIAAIVIGIYTPAIRHDKKPTIDYLGSFFLVASLAALVLAVDNTDVVFKFLTDAGWSLDGIKAGLYGISLLSLVGFIFAERRAKEPVLALRFFKIKNFSLIMAIMTLFGAAFLGAILYLTQFNQQVFGADATQSGLMLLPMIGGMMVTSIAAGQIVSRTGRYKYFLVAGFAIGTLGILALTTLTASTPYWHEAIMMAVIGVGLGMGMPIMNLAVQNEFEQKDLGAATASTQLFRGLGSTVGTAILSGLLTTGIAAHFTGLQNDPYIQQIKKSPQMAQLLTDGKVDANAALAINQNKSTILDGVKKQIPAEVNKAVMAKVPQNLPPAQQAVVNQKASQQAKAISDQQIKKFEKEQNDFSHKITDAFTKSLQRIFYVSFALMAVGFVGTLFVREKKLRDGAGHAAPGIE